MSYPLLIDVLNDELPSRIGTLRDQIPGILQVIRVRISDARRDRGHDPAANDRARDAIVKQLADRSELRPILDAYQGRVQSNGTSEPRAARNLARVVRPSTRDLPENETPEPEPRVLGCLDEALGYGASDEPAPSAGAKRPSEGTVPAGVGAGKTP